MLSDRAILAEARRRWKPFADVAEMAFDDESEIYTAGFADGVRWAIDQIETQAWLGAWECGCSDTERRAAQIPEFCPTHGDKLVSDNKGRTKVPLTHSGVSGYGIHSMDGDRP